MRRRSQRTILFALASGALLLGCQGMPVTPGLQEPAKTAAQSLMPRIQGQVSFPEARQTAATTGEIVSRATVSILDAAGQTLAATVTDAAGAFALDVNGSFTPTTGAYYTVEAIKGLTSNVTASNAVRMRTLMQWTGTAWTSCTGATVAITPTTTAVALIEAKLSAVGFAETMGSVTGSTVTSGNATLNAHWQSVRDMVTDLLWRDLDPVARIGLNGSTFAVVSDRAIVLQPNLGTGTYASSNLMLDGSLQLSGAMPRPKSASEFVYRPAGLAVAGVIAVDGRYVFVHPWTGVASSYTVIGTGFGGTTAGTNHGAFGAATNGTISAALIGGLIYQSLESTSATLQWLNAGLGTVGNTALPTPLLQRNTGLSLVSDWAEICTDGTLLYSGAYSINNGGYNGYTVRVFNPANGFAMVRQMILDGSGTPLKDTSYYTDSFFADGVYLFTMGWDPFGAVRMRRYRLADGQLEAEFFFSQMHDSGANTDDPIYGCYDRVNNKYWFGDYTVGVIHRTAGRAFPASGTWTSAPLDAGSATPLYGRLSFNAVAVNGQTVKFQMRSANDLQALSTATWYGPTGTGDYYTQSGTAANPIHNRKRWVQIQATLTPDTTAMLANSGPLVGGGTGPSPAANTTPRLYGVSLEATP